MHRLIKYYKLGNVLSLDIVAGAITSSLFFAKIFKVKILVSELISLGATVWIIYTIDHLLDTYKTQHLASTVRHRFHQQYQQQLLIILLVAFIVVLSQLPFISKSILKGGCVLFILVILYFLTQKHLKFVKEFFGAVLYTCGILLLPVSLKFEMISELHVILIGQFLITALINLILFSWFDVEYDSIDNRQSFATICEASQVKKTLSILFTINIGLSVFLLTCYSGLALVSFTILSMNLLLLLLCVNKCFFGINDRYRIIGDAIFIIPLFYIFFNP